VEILRTFDDPRIKILENGHNLGIAASQNNALAAATGEYLALMDHDDLSLPDRLRLQVEFLDGYPEVGMVACNCISTIDNDQVQSVSNHFTEDAFLKWQLLLCGCPLFHTSLMVRRSEMEKSGGYNSNYRYAGDYYVISRIAESCQIANLDQPLVKWRHHSASASASNPQQLTDESVEISRRNVEAMMGIKDLGDDIWSTIRTLVMNEPSAPANISSEQVSSAIVFLLALQDKFYQKRNIAKPIRRKHRRYVYTLWGKHFLALALRNNGRRDARCRLTLVQWSARFLLHAASTSQIRCAVQSAAIPTISTQQPL
jgi:glycosyltransferase involved in cell wall biosynthesis